MKKMNGKNSSQSVSKEPKLVFTLKHAIVMIYVMLMFVLFPFFLTNYYSSARRDKFWFFVILTAVAAAAVILVCIIDYLARNTKYYKLRNAYSDPFSLNLCDISILAFLSVNAVSALIATANGGDFMAYFLGSNGRNMGLFSVLMLTIAYFLVSRFFYCKQYVFLFVMFGMAVMSLLAIVNYYYIDPLRIFEHYAKQPSVIKDFTSTIGNKNYLSAMICVALPFSVGMSVSTNSKLTRVISYLSVGLQFMGLIVATSDGGFLGCFFAFAVMLILLSSNLKKLSRLFTCFAIMITSSKLLWLFDILMKGNNKGYSSFSELFVYEHLLFILIPIFAAFAIVCAVIRDDDGRISRYVRIASIVVMSVILTVIAFLFIYFSIISPDAEVGEFTSFFRFNEDWGTHRGFFWIHSFEAFEGFELCDKMFGNGPDSFREVFSQFGSELRAKYGESYTTAAHSVYIQYLTTTGIFGALSYVVFVVTSIKDAVRFAKINPLALACVGAIVAYAFQDIVNIANPVNTPWFILMIALCQSVRLRANNPERMQTIL